MKRMRIYLLTFTLIAVFSGWLRADNYKEAHSNIEFLEAIGTYKRGKATPYEAEKGKAAVAIEYWSEDAEVTVYVGALGNEASKTSADHLKENLAMIKTLEALGKYSNVKIYESSAAREKAGWKSAAFTSGSVNDFTASFIHCKVTTGYLVKIRASTSSLKNDLLETFIKSPQEVVGRVATKR